MTRHEMAHGPHVAEGIGPAALRSPLVVRADLAVLSARTVWGPEVTEGDSESRRAAAPASWKTRGPRCTGIPPIAAGRQRVHR